MTRTLLQVGQANCGYCLDEVAAALLARPQVQGVHANAVSGYIAIDHADDDLAVLEDLIKHRLRGFGTASNGEIVMTPATTELSSTCPHHSLEEPSIPIG